MGHTNFEKNNSLYLFSILDIILCINFVGHVQA